MRIYVSPLWTVLSSVFEVLLGWRRGAPDDWIRFVKSRIEGIDLSPMLAFDRSDRTVPNFLMPVPPTHAPTLSEELEALRQTSPKRIRQDLRAEFGLHIPSEFQLYQVDRKVAFDTFSSAVERYWDAVFEPVWPRMRAVLEREVILCGRVLATEGGIAALSRIHPAFKLRDGAVCYESGRQEHTVTQVGDREIALFPVVAGSDARLTSLDRPDVVVLAYAAQGSSAIWHNATETPTESALVRLLGETKAQISNVLVEPISTTMLAKQLGLAPATISHHLSALTDQGVVEASRVGKVVYYELNERGRLMLDLFSA